MFLGFYKLRYWYVGFEPVPTKLAKIPESRLPPAFSGALNVLVTPEATMRLPPWLVAGSCESTDEGTVKVRCPAFVRQINEVDVVTAVAPVPEVVEEPPTISTRSLAFPPVQLMVRGWLRFTLVGSAGLTVRGVPMVIDALKLPTSVPPAPFTV